MADPLSLTASVIAVATLGLQSTKFIYSSILGLAKASKALTRATQSLQSLTDLLAQIRELAKEEHRIKENTSNKLSSQLDGDLFKEIQNAVQICVGDLDPLEKKLAKWKAPEEKKRWPNKVTSAISVYIKSSDLKEIEDLVSKHINLLSVQLNIASCKQNSQNNVLYTASNSKMIDQMVRIDKSTQDSVTEARQQFSAYHVQAMAISNEHTEAVKAGLSDLGKTTSAFPDQIQASAESLKKSIADQVTDSRDSTQLLINSGFQELLHEIHELRKAEKSNKNDELSRQLQEQVDRLNAINNETTRGLNIDSEEAQLITEDIFSILQTLLDQICLPSPFTNPRKRKTGVIEDDEGAEIEIGVRQRRAVKRMRGLLESSQDVQIRDSVWQKDRLPGGRRMNSQNRVFDTPVGSLAITTISVAPNNSAAIRLGDNEEVTETFAGTLTLLPKAAKKNMKIRAFFTQKVARSGAFSLAPIISFHAVIPDNSKVFKFIRQGNLNGLIGLLQDGLASLTDCDTMGRSLLRYSLYGERGTCHPHICEYLVGKGADVDSLEREGEDDVMIPILALTAFNHWEVNQIENDKMSTCYRLLLDAGADPMVCDTEIRSNLSFPFLHMVVIGMNLKPLQIAVQHSSVMLDLDFRDDFGRSVLFLAIQNACLQARSMGIDYCVEISFKQAEFLLDCGARAFAKNIYGDTCLHLVFRCTMEDREYTEVYRPRHLLTGLVARLITAGADMYALNNWDRSSTELAQWGGYERSWREALTECGFSPQQVYGKSGVEWIEQDDLSAEDELVKALKSIRSEPPQWTPEAMQGFLVGEIRLITDIRKPLSKYSDCSLSHIARDYKADREWVEALRTCGYDPELVYTESGVNWVALEDIIYDSSENEGGELDEEDELSSSEVSSDLDEVTDGDETGMEDEDIAGNKTSRRENEDTKRENWEEGALVFRNTDHTGFCKNAASFTTEDQASISILGLPQDILMDDAMPTSLESPEIHQSKSHLTPANQFCGAFNNPVAFGRLEVVPDDLFDSDMGPENVWSVADPPSHNQSDSEWRDNEQNATFWMRDNNLTSLSNTRGFVTDEWDQQIVKPWSMDFGGETAAWQMSISVEEKSSNQGEADRFVTDV